MTKKEMITLAVTAGVPTLAVFLAFLRNELALTVLSKRVENLDHDLREWARIVMTHNTDIARLKDKAGIQ